MFGVAMYRPGNDHNVGGLLRTAHVFGADVFCLIGATYRRTGTDTTNAAKHMPVTRYAHWQDFVEAWSGRASIVAVENAAAALSLTTYRHPADALYVLGNERYGLPVEVLAGCDDVVRIATPNPWPLNVCTAGSIVIAHRAAGAVAQVVPASMVPRGQAS